MDINNILSAIYLKKKVKDNNRKYKAPFYGHR